MRDLLGVEGGKLLVQLLRQFRDNSPVCAGHFLPNSFADRAQVQPTPQAVDPSTPLRPAPAISYEDSIFDPLTSSAPEVCRRWRAIGHQVRVPFPLSINI